MKYIIKIKEQYLSAFYPHLWSKFSEDKLFAQKFTLEEAENVKKELLNPTMWRTFEEEDIEIVKL